MYAHAKLEHKNKMQCVQNAGFAFLYFESSKWVVSVFAWCISFTCTWTVVLDQHLNSQEKAKTAAFSAAPLQGTDELVTTSSAKF